MTFAEALAAPGQPQAALAALGQLAQATTGARLVTLMTFDPDTGEGERIWTNQPGPYPVGGRKPLEPGPWEAQVIGRRQPFVANSHAEVAAVFGDHELIRSLGCESCLNLPAIVAGQVLGTVNCLDAAGYWTPDRLAQAQALALPAAAAFLLHRHLSKGS
jgi:GAF domain-containing protein